MLDVTENLVQRVEHLEAQNLLLKRGMVLFLILISVVFLTAQGTPKQSVMAEEFVLRDRAGKKRAALFLLNDDPRLELYGSNKKEKLLLLPSMLAIEDEEGRETASISTLVDAGMMRLGSPSHSVWLGALAKDTGVSVNLMEGDKTRLSLSTDGLITGLNILDQKEKLRIILGQVLDQDPTISVADRSGKQTLELSAGDAGPSAVLRDAGGFETHLGSTTLVNPSTGEKHQRSAASLVLIDKNKKVLWSVP